MKRKILLVGFEPRMCEIISKGLENEYSMENSASSGNVSEFNPDAVFLYVPNSEKGLCSIDEIKAFNRDIPVTVIVPSELSKIPIAINFTRHGALEFLTAPIPMDTLKVAV